MSAFTEANVEAILTTAGTNAAALAESLNQSLNSSFALEAGDSGAWHAGPAPDEYSGPGILALFQVGTQGLAILIPQGLPLPEWYTHPSDSEKSRLETLSMEWSMNVLPAEFEVDKFRSLVVSDLASAVNSMSPAEWSATQELQVAGSDVKLLMVWPLEGPNFEIAEAVASPVVPAAAAPSPAPPSAPPGPPRVDPLSRLRHLPVQVSVRLAEKKIPMTQLLGITPGMLITFNKSCEDLLDLYVNNARYCRGEAVKIGENFGLKINQVGVEEEKRHKVIDA